MTVKALTEARMLAAQFLKACNELRDELDAGYVTIPGSKKSGEVRRRSMDLTRKLAELRK